MALVRIPGPKRQFLDTETNAILSRHAADKLLGRSPGSHKKRNLRLIEAKNNPKLQEQIIKATGRGRKRGAKEVAKRRRTELKKIREASIYKVPIRTKNKFKARKTTKGLIVKVPFSTEAIQQTILEARRTNKFYRYLVYLEVEAKSEESKSSHTTYLYGETLATSSFRGIREDWVESDTEQLFNETNFSNNKLLTQSNSDIVTNIKSAVIHFSYK